MDDSWKKEWEKDRKMSYTETYHRPHRETWEDAEQIRNQLGLDSDPELQGWMTQLNEERAAKETEFLALKEMTSLTETEQQRLEELSDA